MPSDHLLTITIIMSITFQLAAALMALWLIRVSGVMTAWILVASGLIFMAARRIMIFVFLILDRPAPSLSFEVVGLVISICMFFGIILIKPLFIRIQKQNEELVMHQRALEELNNSLESRVEAAIAENLEKDRMLMMKGREAAMGEMVRNIAHQWKQPLNSLGLTIQEFQYGWSDRNMTGEQVEKAAEQSMSLIKHMSQTIDDFSGFFNPKKHLSSFSISDRVNMAVSFVTAMCRSKGIGISVETLEDSCINGPGNEFVQVMMNLFHNAVEAFSSSEKKDKQINVRILREGEKALVLVSDNAGGIAPGMLGSLFDAYSTSKANGTGIGLYMSRMIMRNSFKGDIAARNTERGAEFRISI